MRLTESLVKVIFGRAVQCRSKVAALNSACTQHLGVQEKFKKVQAEGKKRGGWQKISYTGYECQRFSKMLEATSNRPVESAIERVLHEVWPKHAANESEQAGSGAASRAVRRRQASNKAKKITEPQKDDQFTDSLCALWRLFHNVTKQMRCKDPTAPDLDKFGENCRDLGARWRILLPANRCTPLYLHTIMMHGGDFMRYLLESELTIGMLENSGAERRHQIGKIQFKKTLSGGGRFYKGMVPCENRSAYFTLRGLLIWQYGRDYLAVEEALKKLRIKVKGSNRKREDDGWNSVQIAGWPGNEKLYPRSDPQDKNKMDSFRQQWASRDSNDQGLHIDTLLTDAILVRIEDPDDVDILNELCILSESQGDDSLADGPLAFEDGEFHHSVQGQNYDSDSSECDGSQSDMDDDDYIHFNNEDDDEDDGDDDDEDYGDDDKDDGDDDEDYGDDDS